jgi:hypothetical protein
VGQKNFKLFFPVKCVNIHFFSHFTWLSQKKLGDGEKLLTYLNSVLKVLSGSDIFPRGIKKSEILLTSVIVKTHYTGDMFRLKNNRHQA